MGTRSLTRIIYDDKPLVCFYQQYDGYPDGYGKELADFISKITLVNGYSLGQVGGTHANGVGCFAAQLIASLKGTGPDSIGGLYIEPTDAGNQEYTYSVYFEWKDGIDTLTRIVCEGHGSEDSYDGDLAGFVAFCSRG